MTPSIAKEVALAFAAALGATLLMAAPVVLAPSERLFGTGDILGREDPNRDALIVIEQFRGGRVPTPYLQPLTDLPGRALARLVGPVVAYNVLVLATFPLSAAAAYLLARRVVGSHLAAMVAGLAYAFLPFHVTQAAGHPHVAQTQWLRCISWPCGAVSTVRICALRPALRLGRAVAPQLTGFIAAVLSPVALVAYGHPPAGRARAPARVASRACRRRRPRSARPVHHFASRSCFVPGPWLCAARALRLEREVVSYVVPGGPPAARVQDLSLGPARSR